MKYQLTKSCPDGNLVILYFDDQVELINHLLAMMTRTNGYDIVAVVQVPA